MTSSPPLCEYCSEIEFDILRNPTAEDLRRINAGADPRAPNQYPFKFNEADRVYQSEKSLGLVSRIKASAATCAFCNAVTTLLHQRPHVIERMRKYGQRDPLCITSIFPCARLLPPQGVTWKNPRADEALDFYYLRRLSLSFRPVGNREVVRPGTVSSDDVTWQRLEECFQTYQPESVAVTDDERILFGGRRRPAILDMSLPARWLKKCLDMHGESCGVAENHKAHSRITPLFRLLDIKEKRVVDLRDVRLPDLKYAALSYVWGGNQRTTLQAANYVELHTSGALEGRLAKTIDDAFHFAGALGVAYLWVDALCIIQDDEADKAAQIGNMANVYADALFTVIAAAGSNAEAGLSGLRDPRDTFQADIVDIQPSTIDPSPTSMSNISLITSLSPGSNLYEHPTADTTWASRGWTLQERAVSRRAITFLQGQILWACGTSHWSEETDAETDLARVSWFALQESEFFLNSSERIWQTPDDETDQIWYRLRSLVLDFTRRKLTVEGDAIDAFSAILEQVKQMTGEHFLWALPATRFELGLCWEPHTQGLSRRTALTTTERTTLRRKVPFPSWSWVGWQGPISFRVEDRYVELGLDPTLLCYVLRNHPLRLVRIARLSADRPNAASKFQHPMMILPKSPLAVTLDDIHSQCPDLTAERLADTPDDQLIFFWAESASFVTSKPILQTPVRVENTPRAERYTKYHRTIEDIDGLIIGQTASCEAVSDDEANESGVCEFLFIADNAPPEHEKQKVTMQIKRRDGVAYRVNVADIDAEAWERAEVSRTLVALG